MEQQQQMRNILDKQKLNRKQGQKDQQLQIKGLPENFQKNDINGLPLVRRKSCQCLRCGQESIKQFKNQHIIIKPLQHQNDDKQQNIILDFSKIDQQYQQNSPSYKNGNYIDSRNGDILKRNISLDTDDSFIYSPPNSQKNIVLQYSYQDQIREKTQSSKQYLNTQSSIYEKNKTSGSKSINNGPGFTVSLKHNYLSKMIQQQQKSELIGKSIFQMNEEFSQNIQVQRAIEEPIFNIEICKNCQEHAHMHKKKEEYYINMFNLCKQNILKYIPKAKIVKNGQQEAPLIGEIAISHNSNLIWSSLIFKSYPSHETIGARVFNYYEDYLNGRDLTKYGFKLQNQGNSELSVLGQGHHKELINKELNQSNTFLRIKKQLQNSQKQDSIKNNDSIQDYTKFNKSFSNFQTPDLKKHSKMSNSQNQQDINQNSQNNTVEIFNNSALYRKSFSNQRIQQNFQNLKQELINQQSNQQKIEQSKNMNISNYLLNVKKIGNEGSQNDIQNLQFDQKQNLRNKNQDSVQTQFKVNIVQDIDNLQQQNQNSQQFLNNNTGDVEIQQFQLLNLQDSQNIQKDSGLLNVYHKSQNLNSIKSLNSAKNVSNDQEMESEMDVSFLQQQYRNQNSQKSFMQRFNQETELKKNDLLVKNTENSKIKVNQIRKKSENQQDQKQNQSKNNQSQNDKKNNQFQDKIINQYKKRSQSSQGFRNSIKNASNIRNSSRIEENFKNFLTGEIISNNSKFISLNNDQNNRILKEQDRFNLLSANDIQYIFSQNEEIQLPIVNSFGIESDIDKFLNIFQVYEKGLSYNPTFKKLINVLCFGQMSEMLKIIRDISYIKQ
ncbi:hypothetical protein PPERSA_01224 [Pseudocohnilembus persalinus]|uniref:Uncharacterized protein n=1 Tax=Pseudocohnilembus persalinus TaxID=266149 RepID=A0A0V0R956_PSEPJ|nr:hypothetical protein PPERSA_01224 [Pseudocohnilembus persalinus]|eukprot:KRX11025.1 hypothetical protein PPERSA_01224 [Pseudocohnilembus persalinus]